MPCCVIVAHKLEDPTGFIYDVVCRNIGAAQTQPVGSTLQRIRSRRMDEEDANWRHPAWSIVRALPRLRIDCRHSWNLSRNCQRAGD